MPTDDTSDSRLDAREISFDAADPTGDRAARRLLASMRGGQYTAPGRVQQLPAESCGCGASYNTNSPHPSRRQGTQNPRTTKTESSAPSSPVIERGALARCSCRGCLGRPAGDNPAFDGGLHGGGIGCEVQTEGCDPDYPYNPNCVAGAYYYFHGNQFETVQDVATALITSPYRSIGRVFSAGSGGIGGATGTLIAPNFILTAAHAVYFGNDVYASQVGFSLAQCGVDCKPFGSVSVSDVWIPVEFTLPLQDQTTATVRARKAFDFAVLKLSQAPQTLDGAPSPATMPTITLAEDLAFIGVTVRSTGYACGRRPPSGPAVDPQACREELWPYTTSAAATLLEIVRDEESGSGTIRADIEATKRMSGSPVWTSLLGAPVQIGVLTGSDCNDGGANWAAALTPATMDRINSVIYSGSHPSMVRRAITYGFFDGGGYGSGFLEVAHCPSL